MLLSGAIVTSPLDGNANVAAGSQAASFATFGLHPGGISTVNTADTGVDDGTNVPTSAVSDLPATENTRQFSVDWSGADYVGGLGIASFQVFVSDNGGAFTQFVGPTAATSSPFTGAYGHSYDFYSIATDEEGNVQPTPLAAQATTVIDMPAIDVTPTEISPTQGVPFNGPAASFTDTDPSATPDLFTASISWGDGDVTAGVVAPGAGGVFVVTGANTYANSGPYVLGVTVTDDSGDVGANTEPVTVAAAPVLSIVGASTIAATAGVPLTNVALATFNDNGGAQPLFAYTATIAWGDGTPSTDGTAAIVNGQIVVSGSYTYATQGVYQPTVTLSDASSSASAMATINVAPALAAPGITQNPAGQSVPAGQTATFTAAASGNPTPTVQWQYSGDGGTTYTDLAGSNTTTLSFTAGAAQNGYLYHAVFVNSQGQATTAAAKLTVAATLVGYWFVSPSGSDKNPGTLAAPFQTIQHAATVAQAGDHVEIRAGTYRETVTPAHSGTAGKPITFEAYNGESVTISGADPIAGWTPYSNNVYSAAMSWDLGEGNNEVFVNGSAINEAVFPNSGVGDFSHPTTLSMQKVKLIGDDSAIIYSSALTQPVINSWKGAIIDMNPGQAWEHQTGTVTASAPGSITVSFEYHDDQILPTAGNTFYLFGKFQALDSAGEWYRDPTTGKLMAWMPNGADPSAQDVEVKRRTYAFNLNNVHDITIHGVNLFAASIVTSASSRDTVINGVNSLYASHNLQIPEGWYISPVGQGIALMGADSVVENSTVAFTSGEGIAIEGADCIVENNIVHDADYTGANIGAITLYSDGDTVDHNTVYNSGRDGIKASVTHATITYNLVHDVGLQTNGSGGIYTANTDGEGSVMAYNEIYDIHSSGAGGNALFANTNTSGWSIHDNLTYNVDFGFTLNLTSTNDLVYNNTLEAISKSVNSAGTGSWNGVKIYNNIYTAPVKYTSGATTYNNATSLAAANSSQGAGSFTAGATAVAVTGSVGGRVTGVGGAPIPGVTIYIDIDNSGTFDTGDLSATTDSTGDYSINNIPVGPRTVEQVLPLGDAQISPAGAIPVTVIAGVALSGENFVDAVPTGSVSGLVTTTNAVPIAGVKIYVDVNNSGTLDAGDLSSTTDSSGNYMIANVPAGAYVVRQLPPPGDTQTTPTSGGGISVAVTAGDSLSSDNFIDAIPIAAFGNVSGAVTTSAGAGVSGVTIYLDSNNDGKLDGGELSTITGSSGDYAFFNVPAGATIIRQMLPSGDTQTSPSGGLGIHITTTTGGSLSNEHFTDTLPATISSKGAVGGFVKTTAGKAIAGVTIYLDTNNNGKLDSGEFSATTDSTGAYLLTDIPAGATIIRQILPSGHKQTTPGSGLGIHITIKTGGTLTNQNFTDS
ncbi:MAG TPA: hypothetical protein VG326_03340 [Tepidisphaeraceae bacterium]|nr:hypothetical protein [Tepidisphaeraceae bacterium]